MAKTKTFWPYGITLSIIGCIALCIYTIVVSLDYPVEMDHFYLEKYQNVNQDINEIRAKQREFETKFDVKLQTKEFKIGSDKNINISITPKNDNTSSSLKYEILLTRPDTNAYNINPNATLINNTLTTSEIDLALEGRWQVMLKLNDNDLVGFYKMEFLAFK
ncbi:MULTISPECIES: FixH family protein [unclassified Campylobacter]|uniref:FixH family protein n=1 Tax=unclassified Campylobacter TaxID=2593542 RepID=UPI003D348558